MSSPGAWAPWGHGEPWGHGVLEDAGSPGDTGSPGARGDGGGWGRRGSAKSWVAAGVGAAGPTGAGRWCTAGWG